MSPSFSFAVGIPADQLSASVSLRRTENTTLRITTGEELSAEAGGGEEDEGVEE